MKITTSLLLCIFTVLSYAQQNKTLPNIFIITTDGFRWQEVFNGADAAIINKPAYVKDTALLKEMYWDNDVEKRRRLLMPFVWNTVEKNGSLYGNKNFNNSVSVANAYKFSYAGYNEILTGYADPAIIKNSEKWNANENLLEYLNKQPEYKNSVAAFASWNLFKYILNKKEASFYLNSGYQTINHSTLSCIETLANAVQDNVVNNVQSTRNDMLTFVTAKEYIQTQHPKIAFISFGETDEHAHSGNYDEYLQSAHLFDQFIAQLWYLVNKDPFYKNNTSFIITTDHGRGNGTGNWVRHGLLTPGSSYTWLMTIGPAFKNEGEAKTKSEKFNEQIAQTVAHALGYDFNPEHTVGDPLLITAGTVK